MIHVLVKILPATQIKIPYTKICAVGIFHGLLEIGQKLEVNIVKNAGHGQFSQCYLTD